MKNLSQNLRDFATKLPLPIKHFRLWVFIFLGLFTFTAFTSQAYIKEGTFFQRMLSRMKAEVAEVMVEADAISEQQAQRLFAGVFSCDAGFYQILGQELKVLNTSSGNYDDLSGSASTSLNAIGYNPNDDFMYGLVVTSTGPLTGTGELVRVDNDGNSIVLSNVGETSIAGDMDANNQLWIRGGGGNGRNLKTISINSPYTVTRMVFGPNSLDLNGIIMADIVIIGDSIYGMGSDNMLTIWDINNQIISRKNVTGWTYGTGSSGTGALASGETFGAGWTDSSGNLYFANNGGVGIQAAVWQITNFSGVGDATAIWVIDSENTALNDGASCPQAVSPFVAKTVSDTCTDPNKYADNCDFDDDGVDNVDDIDDDNDGILDVTELGCGYATATTNTYTMPTGTQLIEGAYATDSTSRVNYSIDLSDASVALLAANNYATTDGVHYIFSDATTNFTSISTISPQTNSLLSEVEWGPSVNGNTDSENINIAQTINLSWSPNVTATVLDPDNQLDIANGITISSGQSLVQAAAYTAAAQPTWSVIFHTNLLTADFVLTTNHVSASNMGTEGYSLNASICFLRDTDDDNIANHLDVESDGDGCFDLAEAGAGLIGDSLTTQSGGYTSVGLNGLADHLETTPDSDSIVYAYQPYAFDLVTNACLDTDMDGIGDLIDIDDDNDGIPDKLETECPETSFFANYTFEDYTSLPVSFSELHKLAGWHQATGATSDFLHNDGFHGPGGGLSTCPPTPSGKGFVGTIHVDGTYSEYVGGNLTQMLEAGKEYQLMSLLGTADNDQTYGGAFNGDVVIYGFTAVQSFPLGYTSIPTPAANMVELLRAPISIPKATWTEQDFVFTPSVDIYAVMMGGEFSANSYLMHDDLILREACNSADGDGDGIVNSLDLDSDGDGCPDAVEAGTIISLTDSLVSGPFGLNGLANHLENNDTDTASITYKNFYAIYATDSTQLVCNADFDGDKVGDLIDIDDDNDGSLDIVESDTIDIDMDGMVNSKDRDSDNDGCYDLAEAGAGAVGDSLVNQNGSFTTVGLNGFADHLETVIDCDIINYTSTYYIAQSSVLNACADSDNDGVGDLVDVDDDNDGVLDVTELSCGGGKAATTTYTMPIGTQLIEGAYTNGSATVDYSIDLTDASVALVAANNYDGNGVHYIFNDATKDFTSISTLSPQTNTLLNKILWGPNLNANTDSENINVAQTINLSWSPNVNATVIDPDGQLDVADGTIINSGQVLVQAATYTAAVKPTWKIIFNTNLLSSDFVLTSNHISAGNMGSEGYDLNANICYLENTDGDALANHLDVDSDGDGCYDLAESGAGAVGDSLVRQSGSYVSVGLNGLANNLETSVDSDSINYTSTYYIAQTNVLNACADSDNDGVGDLVDIDDDNDGILDVIELNCDNGTATTATFTMPIGTQLIEGAYTNDSATANYSIDLTDASVALVAANNYADEKGLHYIFNDATKDFTSILTISPETNTLLNTIQWGPSINGNTDSENINVAQTITLSWSPNVSATVIDPDGQLDIADGTLISAGQALIQVATFTAAAQPTWKIVFNTNLLVSDFVLTTNHVSAANMGSEGYSLNANIGYLENTDNDLLANHLDLDSDGDGCYDAFEGGANNNESVDTIAGPYGANGLANSVETGTESGVLNYDLIHKYVISDFLNLCADTDGDNIPDLVDIDDDNDGIRDSKESPDCFYSIEDITIISGVSTELTIYSTGTIERSIDGNSATNSSFNPNQQITGKELFNVTLTNPFAIKDINFEMVSWALSSSATANKFKLQGYNGAWVDLSTDTSTTATTGIVTIANTLLPNTKFTAVRIYGVSGVSYYSGVKELTLSISNFRAEDFPKDFCSADIDNDGKYNHVDLDSDGDGCYDLAEVGAGSVSDSLVTQDGSYTSVGTNGLADHLETNTDSDSTNYTHYTFAYDSTANACTDFDNDGIGDLIDIDDDNDGVLDVQEIICGGIQVAINGVATNNGNGTGMHIASADYLLGSDTMHLNFESQSNTSHFYHNVAFDGAAYFDFTSYNTVAGSKETYDLTMPTNNKVSGIIKWGPNVTTNVNTYYNQTTSNTSIDVSFSVGVTAIMRDPANQTSIADGTVVNSGDNFQRNTGPTQTRTWYIELTFSNFTSDFQFVADYLTAPSWYTGAMDFTGLTACEDLDTDNDGILNIFDRDSDGDGCPDIVEAGAGPIGDSLVTGRVGLNGLADNLESDDLASASTTYKNSYKYALTSAINGCDDTDGDNIGDLLDLDDDNDGIRDSEESPNCFYTAAEVANGLITSVTSQLAASSYPVRTNWYDGSASTFSDFNPNISVVGKEVYNITLSESLPVTAFKFNMTSYAILSASGRVILQGSNDGASWTDLSAEIGAVKTSGVETITNTLAPNNAYNQYRLLGTVGTCYYAYLTEIEVELNFTRPEDYPKLSCTDDADNDGIYNHLDLDSDNDGCYDLAESGAGPIGDSLTTQNSAFVTVGLNGLADNLEVLADNDTIVFTSSYGYAIDSTVVICDNDFDNDLVGDIIDLDDDNDGILDVNETICTNVGTGLNEINTANGNGAGKHIASANYLLGSDTMHFDLEVMAHSSYFAFNDGFDTQTFDFGSYNTTALTTETWNFAMPTDNMVNGTILWGPDIANNNANSWMTSASSAVGIELTFTAGITAIMHDSGNQTDQADGTVLTSGTIFDKIAGTPTSRTWYVEFTFNNFTDDFQLIADYQGAPSWFGSGVDFTNLSACAEIDTDMDGTPDKFDRDSDGDTCSDAKESGAITSKTDSLAATTYAEVGHNGFVNNIETSNYADAIYNYTSTYPLAQTTLINGCQDYDDDLIGDVIDLDDDNDGIPDNIEMICSGPGSSFDYLKTNNGEGTGMHLTTNRYSMGSDTLDVTIQVMGHSSYWASSNKDGAMDYTSYKAATGAIEKVTFGVPTDNVVNGTILWGPNTNANLNSRYNQNCTVVDITLAWTDGAAAILHDPDNQTNIVDGTSLNSGDVIQRKAGATQTRTWYVTFGLSNFLQDFIINASYGNTTASDFSSGIDFSNLQACSDKDTDKDGIVDRLDTDADGDGCFDAFESGASTNESLDTIPGPHGANGLANSLETNAESDTINYKPIYRYVTSDFLNFCADTDGDSLKDLVDMDDDNDGIRDSQESPECYHNNLEELAQIVAVTSELNLEAVSRPLTYAYDGVVTTASYTGFAPNQNHVDKTIYEITIAGTIPISSIDFQMYNIAFTNGAANTNKLQGWTGLVWEDLDVAANRTVVNAKQTFINTLHPDSAYDKYRVVGVAGVTYYARVYEIIVNASTNFKPENYPMDNCADDTDGDGIYNHLDLDSDNDGCYDLAEAGAGEVGDSLVSQSGSFSSVGTNGLADHLESSADADSINYTYFPFAYAAALDVCADTDNDGIGDLIDLDDDNDGIPDSYEITCTDLITPEVSETNTKNGVSSGVHTAKAVYELGIDTLTLEVVITSTTNYNTNDGQEDGAWNFVSHNGVAGTLEDYTFNMPAGNIISGQMKWGPNMGTNTNTNYNQTTSATNIKLTWAGGVTATMYDPSNQTDIADGTVLSSGFIFNRIAGPTQNRTWYVAFDFNNHVGIFDLTAEYLSAPAWFGSGIDFTAVTACTDRDTDNDGTPDRIDTDADGDLCFDGFEAGAITLEGVDTVAGPYG